MGKKLFDFLGALALLVLAAPLFPLIAAWIKATSSGPVIFRQIRLGYHGMPFTMLKFRTLKDKTGRPMDRILQGDSRVTAPGRFLRKTHLDELPQLINVLLGEMSLVGPRPFELKLSEKCIQEIPLFARRLDVLPGITGLSQIYGRERHIKWGFRGVLRLDLFYIDRHCTLFDLYILFRTTETVLRGKGI
ncbi:sugar transferase [Candidatus Parcubacteria bacterium]|nr:sugar transferase [Candidatus Parcubacteria bacterium]